MKNFPIRLSRSKYMTQKKDTEDRVPRVAVRHKDKTRKKKNKEGRRRRRDSGYKHVHEHQFNSSSAIPLSSLSNYT